MVEVADFLDLCYIPLTAICTGFLVCVVHSFVTKTPTSSTKVCSQIEFFCRTDKLPRYIVSLVVHESYYLSVVQKKSTKYYKSLKFHFDFNILNLLIRYKLYPLYTEQMMG